VHNENQIDECSDARVIQCDGMGGDTD